MLHVLHIVIILSLRLYLRCLLCLLLCLLYLLCLLLLCLLSVVARADGTSRRRGGQSPSRRRPSWRLTRPIRCCPGRWPGRCPTLHARSKTVTKRTQRPWHVVLSLQIG